MGAASILARTVAHMRTGRHLRGYTLTELMIASTVLSIVIFGVLTMYAFSTEMRIADLQRNAAQQRAIVTLRAVRQVMAQNGPQYVKIDDACYSALPATPAGLSFPSAVMTKARYAGHDSQNGIIATVMSTGSTAVSTSAACTQLPDAIARKTAYLPPIFQLDGYIVYTYIYCGMVDKNGVTTYGDGVTAPVMRASGGAVTANDCTGSVNGVTTQQLPRRVRIVVTPKIGSNGSDGAAVLETVLDPFPLPSEYIAPRGAHAHEVVA